MAPLRLYMMTKLKGHARQSAIRAIEDRYEQHLIGLQQALDEIAFLKGQYFRLWLR